MKIRIMGLTIGGLIMASSHLLALPGDIDSTFNANASNGSVWAAAAQSDGKIVIVGDFTSVGGQTRNRVARINADGSLDTGFNPNSNGLTICVAIQPDGKIVIGGQFSQVGGQTRGNIARLNADGTVEGTGTFNPGTGASSEVDGVLLQPDGKIIITGFFTSVNAQARGSIARLNADGTVEGTGTFNIGTGANNSIYSSALQADGKIIISGFFSTFNGTTRNRIARLNSDGTLEGTGTFNPGTGLNNPAYAIAVQPDGKMWLGGDFTTVNGASISRLVRLNADGTTATALTGSPSLVRCVALQTDGKLLVGGDFTALNGQSRIRIARLNADGSLESTSTFNTGAGADNIVRGIALLPDGKIIVSGAYGTFAGSTARPRITHLLNDSASQSLTIPTVSLAQWTRTGAGPEIIRAAFELSTDGGTNWSALGVGTRTANGWDMSGLSLSGGGLIRARGRVTVGNQTGSSSFVETVQSFNTTGPEIGVEQPVNTNLTDGSSTVSFGSGMVGSTSAVKVFTIRNLGFVDLTGVSVTKDGAASAEYTIDTTGMSSTVAAGASTTFSVTFTPAAIGTRTAALHIASDDGDENPFDIALTGDGVVASQIAQQAYAKASNTGTGDVFGASVAISGDTVVVGALSEDSSTTGINSTPNESAADSGAVYVFVRSGSTWTQQAYIKASNTGAGDQFGAFVSIAGDTLVVGALLEDSNTTGINSAPNESATDAGAAYVFVRSGSTWTQQAYLKASNTGGSDRFGNFVSISGDSIIVGAYLEDSGATGINGNQSDNSVTDCGAAYVFTRSGVTWTQQAYLKGSSASISDQFGISVGISGDTVVVGDYGDDSNATGINGNAADNSSADSGAAFVFVRSGVAWTQQAYLKPSNTGVGDLFGFSSAIDGNTIVIGSIREDSNATGINGNQSDNSATEAGAAYVFTRSGTTWTQQAYLKASNTGAGDRLGCSVSISGDTILVGANLEDSAALGIYGNESDNSADDAGASYAFVRAGSTWVQQAYLKASNMDAGDGFGYFVALSGGTAVVGALNEDSNATGIGGTQSNNSLASSGAAYIFTGLGPADIVVEEPVGTALTDGVSSITFGNVPATTTSAAKTFTITNAGVGPMLGISVLKDGTNAADFSLNTTGMSTSLAAGASTTFTVAFAPSASGARAAVLHIGCNDVDESPFDIALTGTGVTAPEIVVEQPVGTFLADGSGNIDFSNVTLATSSTPKTFTITNTGNIALAVTGITVTGSHPGDFAYGSFTPGSLAPNASMTFTVTFTPSTTGARSAIVSIGNDDADEGSFDINVIGSGVAVIAPEIAVEQPVGTPLTRSFQSWGYNANTLTTLPVGLAGQVAEIEPGHEHNVVLKTDGTVAAWGDNTYFQCNVPGGLSNVKAVAGGGYHSLALKNDGTVVVWGFDYFGITNVPGGLTNVKAISGGAFHSLALKTDGTVVAWGYNNHGQIDVPVGLNGVVAVAGGYHHSLALKSDGTVVGWGSNIEGQLNIPVGLSGVTAISAGLYHNLALKNDGTVVAWGTNSFGASTVPGGLTNVISVAAGYLFSAVLKSDGTIVEWGYNSYGQTDVPAGLGGVQSIAVGALHILAFTHNIAFGNQSVGTTSVPKTFAIRNTGNTALNVTGITVTGANPGDFTISAFTPGSIAPNSAISFNLRFSPAATGVRDAVINIASNDADESSFEIAVTGTGVIVLAPEISVVRPNTPATAGVVAWGLNNFGQINVPLAAQSDVIAMSGGESFSLAFKSSGGVVAWGDNSQGQTTVPLAAQSGVIAVSAGAAHAVALKSDGSVLAWGYNMWGQTNVPVAAQSGVIAIAAGYYHTVALKSDGSVLAWGVNFDGQTDVPVAAQSGVIAITAGNNFTAALKNDGSVIAWGATFYQYDFGQTMVPVAAQSGVTAIAAGSGHMLARKTDGSIVSWGGNSTGATTVPPAAQSGVIAIAAGSGHSMALKSDGSVVAWGYNANGESVVPAGLTGAQAIAAGNYHSLALTSIVDFGSQPFAVAGSAKTFTLRNTGNAALHISSVSVIGTNASDFMLNPASLSPTLPATNGENTFTVTFTPGSTGDRRATLRILSDDSDEGTIDIPLMGTGTTAGNANLIILTMSPGGFAPGFDPNITSYAATVSNTTTSVTFTPTIAAFGSTITVDGNSVANGGTSAPVSLNVGSNSIPIVVTAQDTITTKTYTITVTRAGPPGTPGVGDADGSFNPGAIGELVHSTTEQPDGKTIVCGRFTSIGGMARNNIARLLADGSVESTATFNTGTGPTGGTFSAGVYSATMQHDGKILVCGTFASWNGQPRNGFARLNADGTLDSGFNISGAGNIAVFGALMQPDGKVIVFGNFTTFNGQPRNRITRLNSDGTTDGSFDPGTGANEEIIGAALQDDGKILIGGLFTTFNGEARHHIARLNSNGSVESLATFNPGAGVSGAAPFGTRLFSIVVQPDGKIILAGEFITVDGQPRRQLARLHPNGALESSATFNIGAGVENGEVRAVALQADGKIIIGGYFSSVNGQPRNGYARLNADGTLDDGFTVGSGAVGSAAPVTSVAVHSDGKVWITGGFNEVNGQPRNRIARLLNDAATQSLNITSAARIEWLRGGASPEIAQVRFEFSTDEMNWSALGSGTRIAGGWELTGLSLPTNGYSIRARGRVSSCMNSSMAFMEAITNVPVPVTAFRQQYFGITSNTGNAANTADPDLDGLENIVEYAFGLNPVQPGASSQLPQPVQTGNNFGFSFVQPPNVTGIVYGAKCSVNMEDWFPVPDTGSGGAHEFCVPFDVNQRMFLFLVVTPQP